MSFVKTLLVGLFVVNRRTINFSTAELVENFANQMSSDQKRGSTPANELSVDSIITVDGMPSGPSSPGEDSFDSLGSTKHKYRNSIIRSSTPLGYRTIAVDPSYDYSKSTEDNYEANIVSFVGKYSIERSKLDYMYHKYYKESRQLMHDRLIDLFLDTIIYDGDTVCECPIEPWLVFTAGCMGAGKGHTIEWLFQQNLFPLNAFVRVDPDIIRELLPETRGYISLNSLTAGAMTQKEVGYIAEVLTMNALSLGKNILVDGSLRNAAWYAEYIENLRLRFPNLKIAILYVTASVDTVLTRARKRGEITGRLVPEDVILSTLKQLPESMRVLSPYCDFVAAFENEGELPRLLYAFVNSSASGDAALLGSALPLGKKEDVYTSVHNNAHVFHVENWEEDFKQIWTMTCPPIPPIKKRERIRRAASIERLAEMTDSRINE